MNNKEVVQKYFQYLKAGEVEKLQSILHPEIEWYQPGKNKLSGVYCGKSEVLGLFKEFMERSSGTFQICGVDSILENDDHIVATLRFAAKHSDREMKMGGVDLIKVKEGKIREVRLFSEDQKAEDMFWGSRGQS